MSVTTIEDVQKALLSPNDKKKKENKFSAHQALMLEHQTTKVFNNISHAAGITTYLSPKKLNR